MQKKISSAEKTPHHVNQHAEHHTKKELIMEEAKRIFAEKGFHATTMRDIARAAESNIALIYYYFKDKEDLYHTIIDTTISSLFSMVRTSLSMETTPEERIRAFISAYISFMGKQKYLPRILAREMAEKGQHLDLVAREYLQKSHSTLQETLREGSESCSFNELDYELTALSLLGMMGFYFFAAPMVKKILKKSSYDRQFITKLTEHTASLFFQGIQGAKAPERAKAGIKRRAS
ncbi:MAG: CerR family C-terminal domain-containing protein [Candidatus Eremiobacteraeota bacterium]|nr:CerR family C-terminal domain-containing protein [Candidatus Eremiobacteraeota bacterium]